MTFDLTRPADEPAILGGPPAFPEGLPLARPELPDPDRLAEEIRMVLRGTVLTNGARVRELERRVEDHLGLRHAVAVSSCTTGLMLVLRAGGLVSGDVVLPSFTFAATAHAVAWNGLRPVFADIDPRTMTLSPETARRAIGVRTSAILATHVYGTPCDVETLGDAAAEAGIRLFFDAAHAFGSRRRGQPIGGFGDAEVFSLTPTKPLIAGEGGIVTTNDTALAEALRLGRDYGKEPDYDFRFVGLNARMSELHATVALASLDGLEERIEIRNRLAEDYRKLLAGVPGISFPEVDEGDRSTYKDFTVLIEPEGFGMDAPAVARALEAEGIETRRYYSPPVHRTRAYRTAAGTNGDLPATEHAAARVLTLPLFESMREEHLAGVAGAIVRIQHHLGTLSG
jgi:dTDP-4-amino-4,6-dideoxygalactose transaminase